MINEIKWIDLKTLERQTKIDDDKDEFGLLSLFFWDTGISRI